MTNEPIILVHYIAVGGKTTEQARERMKQYADVLKKGDTKPNILNYIIPIKDSDSRIECLNPKLVDGSEYENAKKSLDEIKEKISHFISSDEQDIQNIRKLYDYTDERIEIKKVFDDGFTKKWNITVPVNGIQPWYKRIFNIPKKRC